MHQVLKSWKTGYQVRIHIGIEIKQSACQTSFVVNLEYRYYKDYDTCDVGRQETSIKKSDNFKRAKLLLLITSANLERSQIWTIYVYVGFKSAAVF